ncbi:MAG: T9SS type A sorting domain-containing protein, partial [Ferruginibacter sp.]
PSYITNTNVPLGLKVGVASTYTITADGIDSFNPTVPIILQDLKSGIVHDLRINPVYSFTAAPGDLENRFKVWFTLITSNKEPDNSGIQTFSTNGTIHIVQDGIADGDIYVYSTSGQLVASSGLNLGETKLHTNASGVYIVKVVTKKLTVTQKVVVTK